MKTIKIIFTVLFALTASASFAQEEPIYYVTADSGLNVREEPNAGARRIGKLPLGTAVEIVMRTGDRFDVWSDGKKLSGEWVLVKTHERIEENLGFVFSGFLEDITKPHPVKVKFVDVSLIFDGLKIEDPEVQFETQRETASLDLDLDASYSDKPILVKQGMYKKVALYQRLENEGGLAENFDDGIADVEEAYGGWMKLPVEKRNERFLPYPYTEKVWKQFLSDSALPETTVSKIHVKVVLTDWRNQKTERSIAFNIKKEAQEAISEAEATTLEHIEKQ